MKRSRILTSKRTFNRKLKDRVEEIRMAENEENIAITNYPSVHPELGNNSEVGEKSNSYK